MASLETKSFSNIITFTRASRATYFDSTGIIKSATTNTPRFDYNPITLALRGILVEEQRTNLLTYSEYFDNAAWTPGDATVTANATNAPTGTAVADALIENSATSEHRIISGTISWAGNTQYTVTLFLKQNGRSKVDVLFGTSGNWVNGERLAQFNLSNGTISTTPSSPAVASIESVGNGWYRCRVTATSVAVPSASIISIRMCDAAGLASYAGDNVSGIYIWGAQVEVGAFPTSYVPSSVTFSGRTSTATYFDYTGTLRTALSGEARISYNPSNLNADPFLLLEESRTNSIRNNMMAGAVAGTPGTLPTNWSVYVAPTGITRQIVGTGTVNGVTYIDVRYSGTPSSTAEISLYTEQGSAVSASTGQVWNHSIWLAIVSGSLTNISTISIRTLELNSSSAYLRETAVNVVSQISSTLTRYNLNSAALGASVSRLAPTISVAASAVAPIDITLRIGMPQLELGAGATSVIPTSSVAITRSADTSTSAAATRSADVASINTLDPWYNMNEGTIYAEGTSYAENTAHRPLIYFGNTDNSDRIEIRFLTTSGGAREYVNVGGSTQADFGFTAPASGAIAKMALAYKANDFAGTINGASPSTDSAGLIPTPTRVELGISLSGTNILNGWLRRIVYYPRRLTNAELQALTT
jgi:hypothetical protein